MDPFLLPTTSDSSKYCVVPGLPRDLAFRQNCTRSAQYLVSISRASTLWAVNISLVCLLVSFSPCIFETYNISFRTNQLVRREARKSSLCTSMERRQYYYSRTQALPINNGLVLSILQALHLQTVTFFYIPISVKYNGQKVAIKKFHSQAVFTDQQMMWFKLELFAMSALRFE